MNFNIEHLTKMSKYLNSYDTMDENLTSVLWFFSIGYNYVNKLDEIFKKDDIQTIA